MRKEYVVIAVALMAFLVLSSVPIPYVSSFSLQRTLDLFSSPMQLYVMDGGGGSYSATLYEDQALKETQVQQVSGQQLTTTNTVTAEDVPIASATTVVSSTSSPQPTVTKTQSDLYGSYSTSYVMQPYSVAPSTKMADKPSVDGTASLDLVITYADGTKETISKAVTIRLLPSAIYLKGKIVSSVSARARGTISVNGLGSQGVADIGVRLIMEPYGEGYEWHEYTYARYILTPSQTSTDIDLQITNKPIESFAVLDKIRVYTYIVVYATLTELKDPSLVSSFVEYLKKGSGSFVGISRHIDMHGVFAGPSCDAFYYGASTPTKSIKVTNTYANAEWYLDMVSAPYSSLSTFEYNKVEFPGPYATATFPSNAWFYSIKILKEGDFAFRLRNTRPSSWSGCDLKFTSPVGWKEGTAPLPAPLPAGGFVQVYFTSTRSDDEMEVSVELAYGRGSFGTYTIRSGTYVSVPVTLRNWDDVVLVKFTASKLGGHVWESSGLGGWWYTYSKTAGDWYQFQVSPVQKVELQVSPSGTSVSQSSVTKTVQVQTPEPNAQIEVKAQPNEKLNVNNVEVTTDSSGVAAVTTDSSGIATVQTTSPSVDISYEGNVATLDLGESTYRSVAFTEGGEVKTDSAGVEPAPSFEPGTYISWAIYAAIFALLIALLYVTLRRR